MYSKILVPCDISYEHSTWLQPTIRTAFQIAEKFGGRLYFLVVVPNSLLKGFYPEIYEEEVEDMARKKLGQIVEENAPAGTDVEIMVRHGGIASEIIRAARDLPADLVVLASHGPVLKDYLLGSNASHVALHAPCSVMILRGLGDVEKTSGLLSDIGTSFSAK